MTWLKRLFCMTPIYRDLQSRFESAVLDLTRAQDDVVKYRERSEDLAEKLLASQDRELKTRERLIDFFSKRWGQAIFDTDMPAAPDSPEQPIPARIHGRRLVKEQNAAFARHLLQRLTEE